MLVICRSCNGSLTAAAEAARPGFVDPEAADPPDQDSHKQSAVGVVELLLNAEDVLVLGLGVGRGVEGDLPARCRGRPSAQLQRWKGR